MQGAKHAVPVSEIARDTNGGSPATVSGIAETDGRWSIAVQIRSGATNYDVVVNTTSELVPGADFQFDASGSETTGRRQVFKFDVIAGEQVDAEVVWDNPMDKVKLFLRDESNNPVDINNVGIGSGALSALAATSGRWSSAVRIVSGSTNYNISVNTDPGPDSDGDGIPDFFDVFPNDPAETVDSDGDGIGDNADATPFGNNV